MTGRRAIDTLKVMERRGSITAGMRRAGEIFRNYFRLAQLDPLRASDMNRLPSGGRPAPSSRGGGIEWALEQGWSGHRVSQEAASGILIAALGILEQHFQ